MNRFDELKRNRYIKKMHSNAIAMATGQVKLREGCVKMEYLYDQADYIQSFDDLDIKIFEEFSSATRFFPFTNERHLYNQKYISGLDARLDIIETKYRPLLIEKCQELIHKLQYIKTIA
ncbi:DUF2489 domain-containing protein [Chryseobacterium flavum]|nr:DUF2489 domain-containing protein [Chryseobacterium flavum]